MKKRITLLLLSIALTACGTRQSPDALMVIKYNELEIPKSTSILPVPDANKHNLGYQSAQDAVAKSIKLEGDEKTDTDIIKLWAIKKVNPSIKDEINNLVKSKTIVDTKKEEKRIASNKKNGVSITKGETPRKNINVDKFGINKFLD